MATAQEVGFWQAVAPTARAVASQVPGLFPQTLLIQWADETGFNPTGTPPGSWNLAGISPGGHLAHYRSLQAFMRAYVATIRSPVYAPVLAAPSVVAQLYALGQSPWASGHYALGGVPGQALVDLYRANQGVVDSIAGSYPVAVTASIPAWLPVAVVGIPVGAIVWAELRRL